jgi:hypothetical protein
MRGCEIGLETSSGKICKTFEPDDFWLKEDLQYGVAITKKRSPSFEFRNPQDPTHPSFAYFLICKN